MGDGITTLFLFLLRSHQPVFQSSFVVEALSEFAPFDRTPIAQPPCFVLCRDYLKGLGCPVFQEVLESLRNSQFMVLFMAVLFGSIIGGSVGAIEIYMNTYFWGLGPEQLRWFALAFIGAAASFICVPWIQARYDKKRIILFTFLFNLVDGIVLINLRFLDVLPDNGEALLLYLLVLLQARFQDAAPPMPIPFAVVGLVSLLATIALLGVVLFGHVGHRVLEAGARAAPVDGRVAVEFVLEPGEGLLALGVGQEQGGAADEDEQDARADADRAGVDPRGDDAAPIPPLCPIIPVAQ